MARGVALFLLLTALIMPAGCAETRTSSEPSVPAPADSVEATDPTESTSSTGNGNADVTYVSATQAGDGSWAFEVTIEHPDTGWDDYADGWDVVAPGGEALKASDGDEFTRLLAHPHIDEQPFTRSQSGIAIPDGVTVVVVRAHDIIDGFGGREIIVDLEATSGEGFEVAR